MLSRLKAIFQGAGRAHEAALAAGKMNRLIEFLERKPPSFTKGDVFGPQKIEYDKKRNAVVLSVISNRPVLFWGTFLWRLNSKVSPSSYSMVSPFCVGPEERRVPIIDTASVGWHGVQGASAKYRGASADDLFRCPKCSQESLIVNLSAVYDDEHSIELEAGEVADHFSDSYGYLKIELFCPSCRSSSTVWNEKM